MLSLNIYKKEKNARRPFFVHISLFWTCSWRVLLLLKRRSIKERTGWVRVTFIDTANKVYWNLHVPADLSGPSTGIGFSGGWTFYIRSSFKVKQHLLIDFSELSTSKTLNNELVLKGWTFLHKVKFWGQIACFNWPFWTFHTYGTKNYIWTCL